MKALYHTLILTTSTFLAANLSAQVPGIIAYQGGVTSAGNFSGMGQFKFALVSPPDPTVTTFWSNDGTSVGGSEPASAVSLEVTDGLFTALLGETSLANMQAIPGIVFDHPDVHLRIWFNDGINGFAELSPDQRITSVGYALRAAGTTEGAITAEMLAADSVNGIQLANGSVTEPKIADGAVTAAKIAQPALHTTHLGDGIVTTAKLAN